MLSCRAGLQRTDGVLHSQLVNTLITQVLPQVMYLDAAQVLGLDYML